MKLLLADLLDKCVLVYMDDIMIYSKTADDHVAHVKAVFERLTTKTGMLRRTSVHCSYLKWNSLVM